MRADRADQFTRASGIRRIDGRDQSFDRCIHRSQRGGSMVCAGAASVGSAGGTAAV
jgi:hypothetical protein